MFGILTRPSGVIYLFKGEIIFEKAETDDK